MLDTLFLIAAIIGGTVMICQFLLTLMGMDHDGSDLGHGDVGYGDVGDGDFSGHVDAPGDFHADGDLSTDHHTPLAHAADADYQHPDSTWLFGILSFRTLIAAAAFFGVAGKTALTRRFGAADGAGDCSHCRRHCHVRHVLADAKHVEAHFFW